MRLFDNGRLDVAEDGSRPGYALAFTLPVTKRPDGGHEAKVTLDVAGVDQLRDSLSEWLERCGR